jgi:hypothetical protein
MTEKTTDWVAGELRVTDIEGLPNCELEVGYMLRSLNHSVDGDDLEGCVLKVAVGTDSDIRHGDNFDGLTTTQIRFDDAPDRVQEEFRNSIKRLANFIDPGAYDTDDG